MEQPIEKPTMINLIRKTTQTTYTFALDLLDMKDDSGEDKRKEYLATLIYQSGRLISSSVSYNGEEVDDDQKEEMIDAILMAYEDQLPTEE